MADPLEDGGFVYLNNDRIADIDLSLFFDLDLEFDNSVEEYIERINWQLVGTIESRLGINHLHQRVHPKMSLHPSYVALHRICHRGQSRTSVSDMPFDLKPISQRQRTQPSELAGSWKVFEVSATPIFSDADAAEEGGPPFVYLCMETLKKRSLPGSPAYFGEEELLDLNDVTVLWLPGGVAGYVDVNKEGTLCIGFSWYSDEGINLVMERDYGMDGNLKEVRCKSEVKRL